MCVGPVCDFRALICLEDLKSRLNRVIKKPKNKLFTVSENEFRIILLRIFTQKLATSRIVLNEMTAIKNKQDLFRLVKELLK